MSDHDSRPPREDLIRAVNGNVELRDAGNGAGPVLTGHFAVFNQWTEIKSAWEGHFMERFVPGAFKKTIREQGPSMKVLFQHGQDPSLGDQVLGKITELREDDQGAYYEASLFDGLPPLLMNGLRGGAYGASFRFGVMREEWVDEPKASDYNPNGLPERSVKEAKVPEFGPVTFPAYAGASAGVRSLTDDFLMRAYQRNPELLQEMFEARMDSEDAGTLAQMVALASAYIEDQDESDESGNVTSMQAVQASLIRLLNVEAAETEPVEPEDELNSSAPSESDAATEGSHLTDERREQDPPAPATATRKSKPPIYGTRRKETSRPWLLGPSKSMKRS